MDTGPRTTSVITLASGGRAEFIDATRGAAMLFVFVSHFGLSYFDRAGAERAERISFAVGLLASPTFVLLSGLLFGYLQRTRPREFDLLRVKLADRGLFLLTVGHLLILLAHLPMLGSTGSADWVFMTDAIAIALLLGSTVLHRLGPSARLQLGVGLYVLGEGLRFFWVPQGGVLQFLERALVGGSVDGMVMFPVVPWLGVYLVGSALGDKVDLWLGEERLVRRLVVLGASAVAFGLALRAAWGLAAPHLSEELAAALKTLASPGVKYPPGPAYLGVYGGGGLLLLAGLAFVQRRGWAQGLINALATLGQGSLVVFIAQYYVFYVGFFLAELPWSPLWPVWFAASSAALWGVAVVWKKLGWNRLLTVGLVALVRRVRASARSAQVAQGPRAG